MAEWNRVAMEEDVPSDKACNVQVRVECKMMIDGQLRSLEMAAGGWALMSVAVLIHLKRHIGSWEFETVPDQRALRQLPSTTGP